MIYFKRNMLRDKRWIASNYKQGGRTGPWEYSLVLWQCDAIIKAIKSAGIKCTIYKRNCGSLGDSKVGFVNITFKNKADEAHFILFTSDGIEI